MKIISNCIVCQKPLSGKQRSFCSLKCKNDYYLGYQALKKRANERKQELINSFGGACKRCGYSASLDALSFYNKNGKTLSINTNLLANSNYNKLKMKLAGSQVLCRNCVEEVQNPTEDCRVANAPRNDVDLDIKFAENLKHCGVKPGQTIVLGVSGGVDSIVMLDLFSKVQLKLNIVVAHLNHGIREEAILDEKLVAGLAEKHGFGFVSKTISRPKEGNLEEKLRNERRQFLLQTTLKNGAAFLALAHNANDQAETFIMNAVRGSGPAGLGAMSMSEDQIIRPLLNFSRTEIESYAEQRDLRWHEDQTNTDISYNRNYVRHRILPLLERLNPEYLSAIHRTTHLQRQIDEHLKEEALRVISRNETTAERLRRLDKPLLYEVLSLLYEEVKGNRQNLSLSHLNAIEKLLKSSAGTKTLDLPENIVVRRAYDKLDFFAKLAHNIPSTPGTKKMKLGTQKFGDWEISISPLSSRPSKTSGEISQEFLSDSSTAVGMTNKNSIVIDADLLPHLILRTKKPGDKVEKVGLSGRKKLQDLFVDAKIDRSKRTFWPIIEDTSSGEVIWVPLLAKTKQKSKTKQLLIIRADEVNDETN
jgi:tRNA(Ile)-lysidine synthase